MPNSKELFDDLVAGMQINESQSEKESMAYFLLERLCGITRTDVMAKRMVSKPFAWKEVLTRINHHEPVQYIAGEEVFAGMLLQVTPAVLIPRPETELLVEEAVLEISSKQHARVADIGTGSGCIALAIKKRCPNAIVTATDVSQQALAIAKGNAITHQLDIDFQQHNIITSELPGIYDVVVSNPPYIPLSEESSMQSSVVQFEPREALFVPDDEPLLFYHAICQRAHRALTPGGLLLVEVHESFGAEVASYMATIGFHQVQVLKDLDGKDRMVKSYR